MPDATATCTAARMAPGRNTTTGRGGRSARRRHAMVRPRRRVPPRRVTRRRHLDERPEWRPAQRRATPSNSWIATGQPERREPRERRRTARSVRAVRALGAAIVRAVGAVAGGDGSASPEETESRDCYDEGPWPGRRRYSGRPSVYGTSGVPAAQLLGGGEVRRAVASRRRSYGERRPLRDHRAGPAPA